MAAGGFRFEEAFDDAAEPFPIGERSPVSYPENIGPFFRWLTSGVELMASPGGAVNRERLKLLLRLLLPAGGSARSGDRVIGALISSWFPATMSTGERFLMCNWVVRLGCSCTACCDASCCAFCSPFSAAGGSCFSSSTAEASMLESLSKRSNPRTV